MVDTVQFDVGGKIFKVSRALIDDHPNTMLSKMISEAWENKNDKDKPFFIDRDGDLLRYGSIDLPLSVPKTMFQRELDYYGIVAEYGSIKPITFFECVKANEVQFKHHKLVKDMLDLAAICNIKLLQLGTGAETTRFSLHHESLELYNSYFAAEKEGQELLEQFLNKYFGLTAYIDVGCILEVSVKK